jgi:hypothetical protein
MASMKVEKTVQKIELGAANQLNADGVVGFGVPTNVFVQKSLASNSLNQETPMGSTQLYNLGPNTITSTGMASARDK